MFKMMKNAIIFCILSFILGGCDTQEKPVPLNFGLSSYLSPKSVQEQLHVAAGDWIVLENFEMGLNDPRPPYQRLRILVKGLSDAGVTGDATFFFFNGRLSNIVFYPTDLDSYLRKLKSEKGISLVPGKTNKTPEGALVRMDMDYKGRAYVVYEDPRLEQELKDWDREYA